MSLPDCCLQGFKWDGQPTGRTGKLGKNDTYIAGDDPKIAILLVHDAFGWTFPNARLLADHLASEINATVYVPDFFGGEVLPADLLLSGEWDKAGLPGFLTRNTREIREPEIFAAAHALRKDHGFAKVGAIGYCYGGWAVFRLGAAAEFQPELNAGKPPLVDAISMGHPSFVTKQDIDQVRVPVQILAPEQDEQFTPELKQHAFTTLQESGVLFDYQHFPGVSHGAFTRGDEKNAGERAAMLRAKNAAVAWFKERLRV